jgi:Stress up-regulated Nod 19
MHDGGDDVKLFINGKIICDSVAKYGGASKTSGDWETIGSMSTCPRAIKVKKGDILTLKAFYDLEKHPS